jgi:predicted peroxiredoxin
MITVKKSVVALSVLLALITLLFAYNGKPLQAAAVQKPGVFVNVVSGPDDLHAVSMGLSLAGSALERGHKVVVFLNVQGAALAAKTLSEDVKYEDFPPVKTLVADLIAKGATVFVCGHCATICHVATTDVVEGAKISKHGDVLDALEPGMVSVTY